MPMDDPTNPDHPPSSSTAEGNTVSIRPARVTRRVSFAEFAGMLERDEIDRTVPMKVVLPPEEPPVEDLPFSVRFMNRLRQAGLLLPPTPLLPDPAPAEQLELFRLWEQQLELSFEKEDPETMPKPEMTPTLTVLNDLSYVLECAALDYMGEGKTELDSLCRRLESDPAYAVHDHAKLAAELREALEYYRGGNRQRGANILSWVSRRLWKHYIGGE